MKLFEVFDNITGLERRFRAAQAAVAYFYGVCQSNPTHVGKDFQVRDIRDCALDLEDTYLVRAFAVFEITLRDYWAKRMRRQTHPKAEHLLKGVAARCHHPSEDLGRAHAVRDYRNWLLHGGVKPEMVTMAEARSSMCKFLSQLPRTW
jgi:hypothetical protein